MFHVLDSWYQSLPHWYTVKYLLMFVSHVPGAGFLVPIFTSLVHSEVSCDDCFLCCRCWTHGTNSYHTGKQLSFFLLFVSYLPGVRLMVKTLPHWYTVKFLMMFVPYVPGVRLMVPIFTPLVYSQVSCNVCILCSRYWIYVTNLCLTGTQSSIL